MAIVQRRACDFCRKSEDAVAVLVAGPSVCICDECVQICQDIIAAANRMDALSNAPAGRTPASRAVAFYADEGA